MADVGLYNLARMTVGSSGTGTVTLSNAVTGFLTFDLSGVSTAAAGAIVRYAINDTTQSEIAYGTYTSSALTLTRGSSTTGMKSTNANSPINMSNAAQVFITPQAVDFPWAINTLATTATTTLAAAIVSASATAFAVGLTGATNPAFAVDASTALQVAGLKVTGAVTGGTVAVVTTDSGAATNLTVNAKGTGTIGIGSVSTGRVTITPVTTITGSLTLSAALIYGGVTLSNAVTGTGNMVLSAGPTLTGTTTIATLALTTVGAHTISGAITYGGVALSNAVTGTGNMVLSASPTFTGTLAAAAGTFSTTLAVTGVITGGSVAAGGGAPSLALKLASTVAAAGDGPMIELWEGTARALARIDAVATGSGGGNFEIWTQPNGGGGIVKTFVLSQAGVVTITNLATGSLTSVAGVVTSTSDAALKDVKGKFSRSISDLMRMDAPILYNWNEKSGIPQNETHVGWTAQGVRKGIPEAVSVGPNGMLGLNDRAILAAVINAVLELDKRTTSLAA